MKKFLPSTLIALLISTSVFSQNEKEPVKITPGGSRANQATNSQINLLSPADGKLISSNDASKPVLFRWTAIVPKPKEPVSYRLKVWQLMQEQNGIEAMRSNQPIVTKDVVNLTQVAVSNLYTGPCKPPFLCDFIWAVEVLLAEDNPVGKNYGTATPYKFKFEESIKTDTGSKYKSYQPGKPIYGNICQPPSTDQLNLSLERIIHDADGNVVAMAVKNKNGAINVLANESKLPEFSKKQAIKSSMTDAACLSALQHYLHTGDTRAAGPGICWVWVNCNTPGHMPGCGSMMPTVCDPAPIFK